MVCMLVPVMGRTYFKGLCEKDFRGCQAISESLWFGRQARNHRALYDSQHLKHAILGSFNYGYDSRYKRKHPPRDVSNGLSATLVLFQIHEKSLSDRPFLLGKFRIFVDVTKKLRKLFITNGGKVMQVDDMILDLEQHIEVKGPIAEVFKSVLYRFGEGNMGPDGKSLQMKLEEFAGGRWFRDRGEGISHLWGHIQVIKPPTLIEISGPMFMSYPAINHLALRLEEINGLTKVTLRHRALGMIDPEHRSGVKEGWGMMLESVKTDFSAVGKSK